MALAIFQILRQTSIRLELLEIISKGGCFELAEKTDKTDRQNFQGWPTAGEKCVCE